MKLSATAKDAVANGQAEVSQEDDAEAGFWLDIVRGDCGRRLVAERERRSCRAGGTARPSSTGLVVPGLDQVNATPLPPRPPEGFGSAIGGAGDQRPAQEPPHQTDQLLLRRRSRAGADRRLDVLDPGLIGIVHTRNTEA